MKILDCTLRDGGYYNNWDFEPHVVKSYLQAVAKAKIDYVELGLRNFPQNQFLGAYAYTTESHLATLDLPEGPIYGVMIDAKTILSAPHSIEEAIDILFIPSEKSKVQLVRVAAHFHEVEQSERIVKKLKSLGYMVGYNLMQAGGKPDSVIAEKSSIAASWNMLDVLYFADSLGNMDNNEVKRIVKAIRSKWKGPLGIHTHDNMNKGLENTLTAYSEGVEWLDSTITGMGRGAGNTQTEYLLSIIKNSNSKYNAKPIFELVIRYFEPMQKQYGWGSSLLYFLGAQNDIHPTYIQNLLSNPHYGKDEIVGAIDYLSQLEGTTSYNGSILDTAINFSSSNQKMIHSKSDITNIFEGKNILVLANGPSIKKYSSALCQYIKKINPIVISVNIIDEIPEELINYYIISHNSKFLSDSKRYEMIKKPIILPKNRFTPSELKLLQHNSILNYGLVIEKNTLEIKDDYVISPYDVTASYTMALLTVANAKNITLAGFDGYEKEDNRQQEMIDIFNKFNSLKVKSITPTIYPISKGSLYAIYP
ncbi:aldolase catalytic domain-containing protein [Providencia rettgeri]|uniref:Aldolase catalytic domain-containing protein n=1 Tax=Providencia rettgeri TaxID=587 RepID=A0AAE2ZHM7_PRORE|nr:aldolase catalytic domain-containing protein [Providencia rettgeri]MBW3118325.1 aldolase catalytic domain-containing protein [Providencia rettgeri]NHN53631.1 pyruvate carboxyltransferase [Providencia rettgeri]